MRQGWILGEIHFPIMIIVSAEVGRGYKVEIRHLNLLDLNACRNRQIGAKYVSA